MNKDWDWLIDWYDKCNSEYPLQEKRIHIGTLDNPGFTFDVNLKNTVLENMPFPILKRNVSDEDWIYCSVINHTFSGNSGSRNCMEMIKAFRDWVEKVECIQKN